MDYPGTKFNRPVRLIVLFLFVTAFFLIAPTVILYSAGYRYDFKNGLLRETGSLSIDVLPKGTVAYIDGIKVNGAMPFRLNSITPHKYSLRLSAPNYYDWEKQIEINKNQTTYIKEITLLKNEKPKFLAKIKADSLDLSGSGKYLIATIDNGQKTNIVIIDPQKASTQTAVILNGAKKATLTPSSQSDYVTVDGSGDLYLLNAATQKFVDLTKVVGPVTKYFWNNQGTEPELYLGTSDGIKSYLPRIDQIRAVTDISYPDWLLESGQLWTLTTNTSTKLVAIRQDVLGFDSVFATLTPSAVETTSSLLEWKIASTKFNTLVLHRANQYKIIRQDKTYLITGDHFYISKFNNWFIFWSPSEVWTYSAGGEPSLLNRPGSELLGVQPLDQFNTLAFRWANKITALYPYYFIERTLVDKPTTAMTVDSASKTLYYADKDGIWGLGY